MLLLHQQSTSLSPPPFTEVPVPTQENKSWFLCVLRGIDFTSFYDIAIEFWNCFDSVVCFALFGIDAKMKITENTVQNNKFAQ
jgi:hypothetical protein